MRWLHARLISLIFIFLLSGSLELIAQWRPPQLTELGAKEGLPMVVNDIENDFIGYKYFAGTLGLVRYDGSEFKLMSYDPDDTTTIGPGEVYSMMVGTDSLLWLGMRFDGLNSYDPVTGIFRHYPVPKLPYTTTPTVHGLYDDGKGNIWAGGHHFQLLKLNKSSGEFTSFQPDWVEPETYGRRLGILNIMPDVNDDDLLWLSILDYVTAGTQYAGHGTVSFRVSTGEFKLYPNSGRVLEQTDDGELISSFMTDHIARFNPTTGETVIIETSLPSGQFSTRGILWSPDEILVTNRFALFSVDNENNVSTVFQLNDPLEFALSSIDRDEAGNLWFTNQEGVVILEQANQHIKYFSLDQFGDHSRIYPGRLSYDTATATVYLVTLSLNSDKRIYRIPLAPHENADFISVEEPVAGIAFQSDKTFFAMSGQLQMLDRDGTYRPYVQDGFETHRIPWLWNMRTNDEGWIAGLGLNQFFWFKPGEVDVKAVYRVRDPIFSQDVGEPEFVGFKYTRTGDKALVYNSQLFSIDLNNGAVRKLHYPADFNPDLLGIADVEEDRSGYLWLSGPRYIGKFENRNDSLVLIDKFLIKDGLTSASEASEFFLDNSDRLWIYTVTGISCIDIASREVRTFGVNEGLKQVFIDPRQVITTPDGHIVTVNANGIIHYNPDALWESVSPREVSTVIKDIRLNGIPFTLEKNPNVLDELEIPPFRGTMDISFQGLDYPTAKRLNYSYRLDESGEWIDIGHNTLVTLPTLSPGEYLFQVKASASSGDAPARSLRFTVGTPFYLKPWFLALILVAAILLIAWLYRRRIQSIRKTEQDKAEVNQRIAELELKALRSQMNPHFMFNSLNSIKNYILQAEPKIAAEYLSNFSHLIRMILQNSGAKLITLKEELETLLLYVDLEKLRFDDEFEFNCIVDEGVNLNGVHIPPMILQPYVENAIWHGLMHKKRSGQLTIEVRKSGEFIDCIIEDDGVGRKAAALLKDRSIRKYRSMGMGITKDRIDIINRMDALGISTEVEDLYHADGSASGTRVTIRIPSNIEVDII